MSLGAAGGTVDTNGNNVVFNNGVSGAGGLLRRVTARSRSRR